MLKRTPLHAFHVAAGAKMVDFAGWEMPLWYRSVVEEHVHTRASGSLFDVSHMGRLQFSGSDAQAFLQRVLTRNIADQQVGQCRYSLVCNESGGTLDDVIVSRDARHWLVVCNAANREKLVRHFCELRKRWSMDFDLADQTEATVMVALQGPRVVQRLAAEIPGDWHALKRYHFRNAAQ